VSSEHLTCCYDEVVHRGTGFDPPINQASISTLPPGFATNHLPLDHIRLLEIATCKGHDDSSINRKVRGEAKRHDTQLGIQPWIQQSIIDPVVRTSPL
jgi:hypothetical protein